MCNEKENEPGSERVLAAELPSHPSQLVRILGWVHRIRNLGSVRFILLRERSGIAQVVVPNSVSLAGIGCETVIEVEGRVQPEPRAKTGFEVIAQSVRVVSEAEPPPIEVFKSRQVSNHRMETLLEHRPIALRIPEVREVFTVQSEILRAFAEHLRGRGFTQIVTPKLVLAGAEGGSALFEVEYFNTKAYLAQSPQFYKQMMVGSGMERVFEAGHAYRAEKSETARHLTEYLSLDFEMGFIESEQEVIHEHALLVAGIFNAIRERCGTILERRGIKLPSVRTIPQITFHEARSILQEKYGMATGPEGDLNTEGERMICEWARGEFGVALIYVTGYAMSARPLYTMAQPESPEWSRSFDLLYEGVEITTGGQRIHRYKELVVALTRNGLEPAEYVEYLSAFKHGMPPHGGMGMGLERLTKQMLGLRNIREACLFPRDRYRLRP